MFEFEGSIPPPTQPQGKCYNMGILQPMSPRCSSYTARVTTSLYGGDPGDPRGIEMKMNMIGSESPIVQV
jgi:hypothetical protein